MKKIYLLVVLSGLVPFSPVHAEVNLDLIKLPSGFSIDVYAEGVENTQLWFTDNGRDMMGDDLPVDELNHAPKEGMHFGFPYCHQGDLPDEELGKGKSCDDYVASVANLQPDGAALGLVFYSGKMFPEVYKNRSFIAQHGSWSRSKKVGYRFIALDVLPDGSVLNSEVFASDWLQNEASWGRPNDVFAIPDGALLISDDQAGVIYRISYQQ